MLRVPGSSLVNRQRCRKRKDCWRGSDADEQKNAVIPEADHSGVSDVPRDTRLWLARNAEKFFSGVRSLVDQVALELRECAHHVEEDTAACGRRIDIVGERAKADLAFLKIVHGVD